MRKSHFRHAILVILTTLLCIFSTEANAQQCSYFTGSTPPSPGPNQHQHLPNPDCHPNDGTEIVVPCDIPSSPVDYCVDRLGDEVPCANTVDVVSTYRYKYGDVYPQGFTSIDGIGNTDPARCRTGSDYMISGAICLVQSMFARSIFHVYCAIFLDTQPLLGILLVMFIMFYAIASLFGINNAGKDVGIVVTKLILITLLVANADLYFFFFYEGILGMMDDFSTMLMESMPLYDHQGDVAMQKVWIDPYAATWNWEYFATNGRACLQNTFINGPSLSEYPPPGCECFTSLTDTLRSPCRIPEPPTDLYGAPVWEMNPDGSVTILDDAMGLPRVPYKGSIFDHMDVIFKAVTSENSENTNLMFLALSIAMVSSGAGFFLNLLVMLGLFASLFAFLRIMVGYLLAIMTVCFLMMLGPIFLCFALFQYTAPLFRRWLTNILSYSLQPFIVLGFVFVISQAHSIRSLGNSLLMEHGVSGDRTYIFGWKGFWEFQVNGPMLNPFYCTSGVDDKGVAIPGKDCSCFRRNAAGEFVPFPAEGQSIADRSDPTQACDVANNSDYQLRCIGGNDGKLHTDCYDLACISKLSNGEWPADYLNAQKRGDCSFAHEINAISKRVIGIILVWIAICILTTGFMQLIPQLARSIVKIFGRPAGGEPIMGGNSSVENVAWGVAGRAAQAADKGLAAAGVTPRLSKNLSTIRSGVRGEEIHPHEKIYRGNEHLKGTDPYKE